MSIFRDDSEAPRINMNGRQKLFVLAIDFAIIAELCIAMSVASSNMDTFTPTFMKIFFAMFVPTLLAGFIGHRRLRDSTESVDS
ncbi:MAG: hypothetical protein Q7U56_04390 [Humidesulfovibrio sp.]|nr:hypothetical protein [Desulfovibrio sp.]MDO9082502.1 hypothetical protein [Humidesulfovibrio sp.]